MVLFWSLWYKSRSTKSLTVAVQTGSWRYSVVHSSRKNQGRVGYSDIEEFYC